MKTALITLFLIGIAGTTFLPADVAAQGLVNCSGPDCNFCSAADLTNNIVNWLIGFLVLLAVLSFVVAGFRLVTSGGDTAAMNFLKDRLKNIAIGFLLILTSWLIIDAILEGLTGEGMEIWGSFPVERCGTMNTADSLVAVEEPEFTPLNILTDLPGWSVGQGYSGSNYTSTVGDAVCASAAECAEREEQCEQQGGISEFDPDEGVVHCIFASGTGAHTPAPDADGSLDYQSGIQAQIGHASPALSSMLNCIADRVPANVGQLSSISDSRIVSGAETFASCRDGGCAHAQNSCHYGGPSGGNASVAADFGDESNVTEICAAARSCGAVADCSVHNGNHVHLSLAGYSCR